MRQAKIYRKDTLAGVLTEDGGASATMGIEENVTMQLIASMKNALPAWSELINNSFLSKDMKEAYLELIDKRIKALSKD